MKMEDPHIKAWMKRKKQENLELILDRFSSEQIYRIQIYQTMGIIGAGLCAFGSLISRYYFKSEDVARCFDIGMFADIGYTIGASWMKYMIKHPYVKSSVDNQKSLED